MIASHDSKSYCPTIIIENIRWFTFITIIDHTEDKINNQITLLPSLLNVFSIFNMRMWDDNENLEENVVDNICLSVCRSVLQYPKDYSLLGGLVPTQSIG